MRFLTDLRRLWRHGLFRKLVAVRIGTQTADGMLQVAMAAYVLLSPQQQPDAASIAIVLAITYLPYSFIGPFVSLTLDRWNRRQVAVMTDLVRVAICVLLAILVMNPHLREHWTMWVFYGGVLLAMSLNRYLMAGLSAALPHTVDEDEYLMASSVMPMIGPGSAVIGGGIVFLIRSVAGQAGLPTYRADAIAFTVAAAGFLLTVLLALRIPREALGPDHLTAESRETQISEVARGLRHALDHLAERRPAAMGLLTIGLQRVLYGMTQVATILLFRNWFHDVSDVDSAMVDIGLWGGATGLGFVLSAAVVPPLARRIGVRRSIAVVVVTAGILQIVPGSIFTLPTLLVAGFLLGICSQSLKICVDTLVQAHVDDDFKGRVFTIYDMIFNACFVLAAVMVALLFPPDAHSLVGFVTIGALLIGVGIVFWIRSGRLGTAVFDRGTDAVVAERA